MIIHQHQLGVALRAVLAGHVPTYDLPRDLVLHGNPDVRMERIRISVNMAGLQPDPKVQRAVKDRSHAAMTRYFEQWRADKSKQFDDWYRQERRGHAENFAFLFRERIALMQRVAGLEEQAGPVHVRLVADVYYGDDWSVPYREILFHERERQGRRGRS